MTQLLALVVVLSLAYALTREARRRGWLRWSDNELRMQDVPCESCVQRYGTPHECDSIRYCPCDQPRYHLNK